MRTGDDKRRPFVVQQISRALGEPLGLRVETLGEFGERSLAGDFFRERRGEREDVAAREAQAMIGHRAGQRERALRHIKAVHRIVFLGDATTFREFAGVIQAARFAAQEISIEGNNALSLGETVNRFHRLAENGLRGRGGRFVGDGLVLGPDGLREIATDLFHQTRTRRRRGFFREERQTGTLRGRVRRTDGREEIVDGGSIDHRASRRVSGRAFRIVEIEDGGLG